MIKVKFNENFKCPLCSQKFCIEKDIHQQPKVYNDCFDWSILVMYCTNLNCDLFSNDELDNCICISNASYLNKIYVLFEYDLFRYYWSEFNPDSISYYFNYSNDSDDPSYSTKIYYTSYKTKNNVYDINKIIKEMCLFYKHRVFL